MSRSSFLRTILLVLLAPAAASATPVAALPAAGAELGALALLLVGLLGLGIAGSPRVRGDRPDAPPTVREAPAGERLIA